MLREGAMRPEKHANEDQLFHFITTFPESLAFARSTLTVGAGGLNVAVTVQLLAGMVPVYVVVPDPPQPDTLAKVEPPVAVTVHE